MLPVLEVEQVRRLEQRWMAEHPDQDLMLLAADQVRQLASQMLAGAQTNRAVLVVAGPGNNAGDGLFAAAGLADQHPVLIWTTSDHTHAGGLRAALSAGATLVSHQQVLEVLTAPLPDRAALVIDALSGIGGRPGLPDQVVDIFRAAGRSRVPVLAVDLPSGLAADSGATDQPHVRATATLCCIAPKIAHVVEPARGACGRIVVAGLGVEVSPGECDEHPLWQVEPSDIAEWYPWPTAASDKYSRGVVGLDTGSKTYPGAALLGISGALGIGVGMVRYLGGAKQTIIVGNHPSVVTADGRVQAMVVGSGVPNGEASAKLRAAIDRRVPIVVDAGAIGALTSKDGPVSLPDGSILTPHAGELARFLGIERDQVEADPVQAVRTAVERAGCCVLLKGSTQYIGRTDGSVWIAPDSLPLDGHAGREDGAGMSVLRDPGPVGSAWNAQAGSGDVLAGAIGSMLAAGLAPGRAAAIACAVQAEVANHGPATPDQMADAMGSVLAALASGRPAHC